MGYCNISDIPYAEIQQKINSRIYEAIVNNIQPYAKESLEYSRKFGKAFSSDNSGDGPKNNKGNKLKNFARGVARDALSEYVGKAGAKAAIKGVNMLSNKKKKSKNNKKKSNPQRNVSLIRSVISGDGTIKLSESTSKYVLAHLHPFDQRVKSVGTPRPGSAPSFKVTGYLRGSGVIGKKGLGFVWFVPCLASNNLAVGYTTVDYDSSIISYISSDAGTDTFSGSANSPACVCMSNLPYTAGELSQATTGNKGVEGRVVAASLQCQYTGTLLERSGQYYAYSDPDLTPVVCQNHNNATAPSGDPTVATLSAREACEIRNVDGRPIRTLIIPQSSNQLDYPNFNSTELRKIYPFSQGQAYITNRGLPSTVIAITGVAGQPFYWEAVLHAEYIGPSVVQSMLSQSFSDSIGFDTIQCAMARAVRANAADPYSSLEDVIKRELRQEKVIVGRCDRPRCLSLNGSHGEYTNSDDVDFQAKYYIFRIQGVRFRYSVILCEDGEGLSLVSIIKTRRSLIRGGGMIDNKVKNKGTGGKSKVKKIVESGLSTEEKIRILNKTYKLSHRGKCDKENEQEKSGRIAPTVSDFVNPADLIMKILKSSKANQKKTSTDQEKAKSEEKQEKVEKQETSEETGDDSSELSDSDDDESENSKKKKKKELPFVVINKKTDSKDSFTALELLQKELTDHITEYDYNGAPFCGYACINRGSNQPFESDNKSLITHCQKLMKLRKLKDPWDIGTVASLNMYADLVGVNVIYLYDTKRMDEDSIQAALTAGLFCRERIGGYHVIEKHFNDVRNKTIFLIFKAGASENRGHWVAGIVMVGDKSNVQLPLDLSEPVTKTFSFYSRFKLVRSNVYPHHDLSLDVRRPNARREKIEINDSYSLVEKTSSILVNPYWLAGFTGLTMSTCLFFNSLNSENVKTFFTSFFRATARALPRFMLSGLFMWGSQFLCNQTFKINLTNTKMIVSDVYCATMYPEIQAGKINDAVFLRPLQSSNVNSDINVPNLIKNSIDYMKTLAQNMNYEQSEQNIAYDAVQYNEPTSNTFVETKVLKSIKNNQNIALMANGKGKKRISGKGVSLPTPNHIIRCDVSMDESKYNIPVATAPIGVIVTDKGEIGPGSMPLTDPVGVLAAFTIRSMSKDERASGEILNEFLEVSKNFVDEMVDGCDFSGVVEENHIDFFRNHYRGKIPQSEVESIVQMVEEHELFGITTKETKHNSCFVKFENSSKRYGAEVSVKPRLIMTMNKISLVHCCQFVKLIDIWNDGPFGRFQVKHMTPEEMIEKIMKAQNKSHMVTDFSSFESSLTNEVLNVERYCVSKICDKAGFRDTKLHYLRLNGVGRKLKSKKQQFFIETRCSGDTTTSFGNGLLSACVFNYMAYKMGKPFDIICEGDDGIIPSENFSQEIINKLAFKISSEVSGNYAGDTDFLSKRYKNGKIFLNVGKSLNVLWVKTTKNLRRSRRMFILRCMALSMYHMSPGHPILTSLINKIMRETKNYNKSFKGWQEYIDPYVIRNIDFSIDIESEVKNFGFIEVDESMRNDIAEGAIGFPPISIPVQLYLEQAFSSNDMYVGGLLNDYPEVNNYVASRRSSLLNERPINPTMLELVEWCNNNALHKM